MLETIGDILTSTLVTCTFLSVDLSLLNLKIPSKGNKKDPVSPCPHLNAEPLLSLSSGSYILNNSGRSLDGILKYLRTLSPTMIFFSSVLPYPKFPQSLD